MFPLYRYALLIVALLFSQTRVAHATGHAPHSDAPHSAEPTWSAYNDHDVLTYDVLALVVVQSAAASVSTTSTPPPDLTLRRAPQQPARTAEVPRESAFSPLTPVRGPPAYNYDEARRTFAPGGAGPELIDPRKLRFTQSDASPNFSRGGTISDLVDDLTTGRVKPHEVAPLEVVEYQGKLFSLDNRRLAAFSLAQKEAPIVRRALSNPAVRERFLERFDPIGGEGRFIVIAGRKEREAAQLLLREHGLIRGIGLE